MHHDYDARDRFADEIAEEKIEQQARRLARRYSCCDGFCGALDCYTCRGSSAVSYIQGEMEREERVRQSDSIVRVSIAAKPRKVGLPGEIRVGDQVRCESWFDYEVNGPRLSYHHLYRRLKKGPRWGEEREL